MRGRVVRSRVLRDRWVEQRTVWDADRLQAALNVAAGVAFSAGSLLFLDSSLTRLGIYLFVVGSLAMAIGAIAVWQTRYAGEGAGSATRSPDRHSPDRHSPDRHSPDRHSADASGAYRPDADRHGADRREAPRLKAW